MEDLSSSSSFLTDLRHCGNQLASGGGGEFDLNSTCIKQHYNLNSFAGEVSQNSAFIHWDSKMALVPLIFITEISQRYHSTQN